MAKTPDNISDDQASGLMLASLAVLTATTTGQATDCLHRGTRAGIKSVMVPQWSSLAAALPCQYAIQLARLSGFSKIITNSSPAHKDYLHRLGATVVLDREAMADGFTATI